VEGQLKHRCDRKTLQAVVALAMAACICAPVRAQQPKAELNVRAGAAAAAAARWLDKQFDEDGVVAGEFPSEDIRHGGRTALAVYAMLSASIRPTEGSGLLRGLDRLGQFPPKSTYAVSMRICALALADREDQRKLLAQDTRWLLDAMNDRGAYTYTPADEDRPDAYDNSNTQLAVLAVHAAGRAGIDVPLAWWRKVEEHWLSQQQLDGGWPYRIPARALQARSYGSMSAAGTASLLLCDDVLHRDDFVRCTRARRSEPIIQGLDWLARNFSAQSNPGKGVEWYYYWLFCAQRVGLLSGQKRFGQADWREQSLRNLLRRQGKDGAFGYGDRITNTALALVVLTRGRSGVLVNKIRYTGKWNARPRDAAHLAAWVTRTFEAPCRWQIVDLAENPDDLYDAPIAYLSGAGAAAFSDDQIQALRRYVLAGGLIVSEAACSNGDFTLDMQRAYQKMFPDRRLERLDADHLLFTLHRKIEQPPGVLALQSPTRLWAVHLPQEVSLALQSGKTQTYAGTYDLLANLVLYASDLGTIGPVAPLPEVPELPRPRQTVSLAVIQHQAQWRCEPEAMRRLAAHLAGHNIALETSQPMHASQLNARRWSVARLSGAGALKPSPAEIKALGKYVSEGGTLLIDAAGGDRAFRESVDDLLADLSENAPRALPERHDVFTEGLHQIRAVRFRRKGRSASADQVPAPPRILAVGQDDRLGILYSPGDVTAGLAGVRNPGLSGYLPEDAMKLYANLLLYAAQGRQDAKTTSPEE
jgi:hypothetical protein